MAVRIVLWFHGGLVFKVAGGCQWEGRRQKNVSCVLSLVQPRPILILESLWGLLVGPRCMTNILPLYLARCCYPPANRTVFFLFSRYSELRSTRTHAVSFLKNFLIFSNSVKILNFKQLRSLKVSYYFSTLERSTGYGLLYYHHHLTVLLFITSFLDLHQDFCLPSRSLPPPRFPSPNSSSLDYHSRPLPHSCCSLP